MLILIYFTLPQSTSVGECFDKSSDLEKQRPAPFPETLSQAVGSPPPASTLAKTRATLRICHGLYFRLPLPNYHWQMIFAFSFFFFFPALGEDFLAETPGARKKKRQTAAQSSNVLKLTTRQIVGQDISVEPHTHTLHLVLNPFPPATI